MIYDMLRWQGLGTSPGCAAGRVWVLRSQKPSLTQADKCLPGDNDTEVERLKHATHAAHERLLQMEGKVRAEQGDEVAQIFAAHRMLLHDPAFSGEACERIQSQRLSAEQAITQVAEETMAAFSQLEDEYFRERAGDIKDILQQLLQILDDRDGASDDRQFPDEGRYIVIAEELTPAQTVGLPKDRVLGFIVHKGGKTSHAAILARTYGIPAVIANTITWEELESLKAARIDGEEGWIEGLTMEQVMAADVAVDTDVWSDVALPPAFAGLTLAANIGGPMDLAYVEKYQAQGVGLYRTEFLFMGARLPTEDEQVAAYHEVISACQPHLTVIRTLDIGGDKQTPALDLPKEQNPFLGVRAIRLCLQQPQMFVTQLRALWRASVAGPTAVMFPMITTVEELQQAKQYLDQARLEVIREGYSVGDIQIGIMIEVPAAALMARKLAKEVDFFSIGTNDLTQYTLAVDRENSSVAILGQYYHPAVLSLVAHTVEAAKENGIWVGVCGEAGGDTLLIPFFTALGVHELSMAPGQLPRVRRKLSQITLNQEQQEALVKNVLECSSAEEVKTLLSGT